MPEAARGKLIDSCSSDYVEPQLVSRPSSMTTRATSRRWPRPSPATANVVERFEGYLAGMELCNAFTELNDPLDQEQRFLDMGRDYTDDEEEKNPLDEDYLRAMRYGMPPNGGFGMGIDRLTMLAAALPAMCAHSPGSELC